MSAVEFTSLYVSMGMFTLFIGIGMLVAIKIKLTPDVRKFIVFIVLNVGLPAIILNSFFQVQFDDDLFQQMILVFILAMGLYSISFLFIRLILNFFHFTKEKQREISFVSNLGNTGFIGIPLCGAIFGPKGTLLAAAFDVATCIFIYSIGSMILQNNMKISLHSLRKIITLPLLSVVFGIIFILLNINIPLFLKDFVSMTGSIATPIALIYVGMLSFTLIIEKQRVESKPLVFSIIYKLAIFPLLGIVILLFVPMSIELKSIFLVEVSMPTIATASVFFTQFGNDENYAVVHTLSTSLLSLLTIPLIVYIGLLIL